MINLTFKEVETTNFSYKDIELEHFQNIQYNSSKYIFSRFQHYSPYYGFNFNKGAEKKENYVIYGLVKDTRLLKKPGPFAIGRPVVQFYIHRYEEGFIICFNYEQLFENGTHTFHKFETWDELISFLMELNIIINKKACGNEF
jgi:hypothetical protein